MLFLPCFLVTFMHRKKAAGKFKLGYARFIRLRKVCYTGVVPVQVKPVLR